MSDTVCTRTFGAADQARFALVSGDANPLHLDAIAARRTPAGAPVVHGVHLVLWAIDALAAAGKIAAPIASLAVTFERFVYLGCEASVLVTGETATSLRIVVAAGGSAAVRIACRLGAAKADRPPALAAPAIAVPASPRVLDIPDVFGNAGALAPLDPNVVGALFPHAAARLGARRTAAAAQLSALVGMVCPGLYAVFAGFRVDAHCDDSVPQRLCYAVARVDERVRMATLAVAGGAVAGELTAFVRRPPPGVEPAQMPARVRPDEFASTTALVVGGSRGLGAATARLIAAGGGRVTITYRVGEADARAVAAEIGGRCAVLRYDARENAAEQLTALDGEPHQLYYFATPHIVRPTSRRFDPRRFAEFCQLYVDGFARTCEALRERVGSFAAFYPSSVAVESRPADMTEYAMAKAAGEVLCTDMDRFERNVRVLVKRLPRTETDQTASFIPVETARPIDVMLPIVRAMRELEP